MSGFKVTSNKRQREAEQRDRVLQREARRADRRERTAARAASGEAGSGPPMGEAPEPLGELYVRPPDSERAPTPKPGRGGTKIFVGNLAFDTDAESLRALFAGIGAVSDVHVPTDRETGRPRGFAFVTMATSADAEKAIKATDGHMLDGRAIRVNEAEERPRSGGPRSGGGGRRF